MEQFTIPEFNFVLKLDGQGVGRFREVSGLEDDPFSKVMPGLRKGPDVTCMQGRLNAALLADWQPDGGGIIHRKEVTIELVNETGCAVMTWQATNAWVKKVTLSQSPAEPGEVSLEKLVLAHEGVVPKRIE